MSAPRHILIVEDSADDAELAARALRRGGCELTYERVETPEAMRAALARTKWDLVIADYSMPHFNGLAALQLLQEQGLDLPFILVSGAVGEDVAVQAMKAGAHDYVLKNNLSRLPPAVERELRESEVRREGRRAESRYRNLFASVPVGVFITTPEGRILEANPTFVEMLGFEDAQSLKQVNIGDLWAHPEERARLTALIASGGIEQNFEMEFRRRDDSVIWCAESARAIYDAPGKVDYYEEVAVNVTARKRVEEEVSRARSLALDSVRLRSDFMRNMSHEIRTPLVGIVGMSELMMASEMTAEQRECAAVVGGCADSLLNIVNDILDFSKLAAGTVVLQHFNFDHLELLETLVNSFAGAAHAKRIELALYVDVKMPTGLRGDPTRLRQILKNLMSNAIKFTSAGEVLVRAFRMEDSADQVLMRFEVTDTGIGIPPQAKGLLFQPFVQADGSMTRPYGGTGLGLAIAAQLAEQMGGEVGFESEPGKGATFHFTVRLEKGAEIVRPWMTASAISMFKGTRALIIYDSPLGRQIISECLWSWGISNMPLGSGAEALDSLLAHASTGTQAIALVDERLPEALKLARTIKTHPSLKGTKVIMLGAEGTEKNSTAAVDVWIAKPIRPSHLFNGLFELFSDAHHDGAKASRLATLSPLAHAKHEWRKGVRVLHIHEHILNQTIMAKQLSVLGYTEEVVEDARRGLEVASGGGCDIVLMDCEMPAMDGYQATGEIRRREGNTRHVVVIGLTTSATEHDRGRCLEAGMDGCLNKPIKLNALAKALDPWAPRVSALA
ncbi:MAG TPA: response regulator [Candidatus Binataceae bacterium]